MFGGSSQEALVNLYSFDMTYDNPTEKNKDEPTKLVIEPLS